MCSDGCYFEYMIDIMLLLDFVLCGFGFICVLWVEDNGWLWIGSECGIYLCSLDGVLWWVLVDFVFYGDISKIWWIEGGGDEVWVVISGGLLCIGFDGVVWLVFVWFIGLCLMSSVCDVWGWLWVGMLNGVWLDDGDGIGCMFIGYLLLFGGLFVDGVW